MKVIIAGSRTIHTLAFVEDAVKESGFNPTEIVVGGALGVDWLGEIWAKKNNIPFVRFMPDWNSYGKAAGPIRNKQMAEYADALIAIWDGKSKGTWNMIESAKINNLKIFIRAIE